MNETWRRVMPVAVSICIIVSVSVVQARSRPLAAIIAAMPINVPLALWIIYASSGGDRGAMLQFTGALIAPLVGVICFVGAAWLAARAGWRLGPILTVGYLAWGLTLGLYAGMRYLLAR